MLPARLRVFLVALCAVLSFGAPVSAGLAKAANAPCAMADGAGGEDAPLDCCGDLAALSLCAQACGFASGCVPLMFAPAVAAPPAVCSLIPRSPDRELASLTGPPPLHPPR